MQWVRSEYLLKGIYLGLLLFMALQNPDWSVTGRIGLWMVGGLAIALLVGILVQIRDLAKLLKKPVAFLLFLILENPMLVYAGIIFGLAGGVITEKPNAEETSLLSNLVGGISVGSHDLQMELRMTLLLICIGGGAILGYGFGELRKIRDFRYRFILSFAVAGMLVAAIWMALEEGTLPFPVSPEDRPRLGFLLLLGVPFFYLLTFTGVAEESEVEIAMVCALLGTGIFLTKFAHKLPAVSFLLPITLYFVYSTRFLNGLRIFKHVVRGYCYLRLNKIKNALRSAQRALQLDRTSVLGNQLMWAIHQEVDLDLAAKDPELLQLLDINRCMNRVSILLIANRSPNEKQIEESNKLLNLVEKQAPVFFSHVEYYRAVGCLHLKQTEQAATYLNHLLDPGEWLPGDINRKTILFSAWQLALVLHPAMKAQVGEIQIRLPGRKIEAIQAVERHLGENPNDPDAKQLQSRLYSELMEEEYLAAAGNGGLGDFDYGIVGQNGTALIETENWLRGAEYLRILAHGVPQQAPGIYQKLSIVAQKRDYAEAAEKYLHLVKRTGLEVGTGNLPPDQKQIYFNVVKQLADIAAARGNFDEAIQDYSIYTQFEGSGKETLRKLAEMYAEKKEPLESLRITEKALLYGTDNDLQQKKDSYYYSVTPEQLGQVRDEVKGYFDVSYCVRKSKSLLDSRSEDLELLDWAEHLVKLALVMQPKNIVALVQRARALLRRGESETALQILEDAHELKPSGNDESDAWFFGVKQLGILYLDHFKRADLALGCFQQYQESLKSGADTYFNIARCHEALGDQPNAIKHYRMVTGFEEHPLRWEAEEAIRRLRGEVSSSS